MPLYAYTCTECGPFDAWRGVDEGLVPPPCPGCAGSTRRVYTAPATRSRSGAFAGASAADSGRRDRALTGEPVVTGPPTGRRVTGGRHPH